MAARASLASVPPSRTPERQRLADAIAERDRRLGLLAAKRAEMEAAEHRKYPLWTRRTELETALQDALGFGGENERVNALLRGETLRRNDEASHIRAELAQIEDALQAIRNEVTALEGDVKLLESTVHYAKLEVSAARDAVIRTDPVVPLVVAEFKAAKARAAALARAIEGTLNVLDPVTGPSLRFVMSEPMVRVVPPPCPWHEAKERLLSDPDAVLPMPDQI